MEKVLMDRQTECKVKTYMFCVYDVDKVAGAGDGPNKALAPWNDHWVHHLKKMLFFLNLNYSRYHSAHSYPLPDQFWVDWAVSHSLHFLKPHHFSPVSRQICSPPLSRVKLSWVEAILVQVNFGEIFMLQMLNSKWISQKDKKRQKKKNKRNVQNSCSACCTEIGCKSF